MTRAIPHSARAVARRKATNAHANPPGSEGVGSGLLTVEMTRGAGARPRSRAGAGTAGGGGGSRRGRSSPLATGETATVSAGGGNSTGRGGAARPGVARSATAVIARMPARPVISASPGSLGLRLRARGVPRRRRGRSLERRQTALGPADEIRILAGVDDLAVRALGALFVGGGFQRGGEACQPLEVSLGCRRRLCDHGAVGLGGIRVAAELQRALADQQQCLAPLLAPEIGD